MADVLDTNLRDLFSDRKLLDRVIRGIALDTGATYVESLDRLHHVVRFRVCRRQRLTDATRRAGAGRRGRGFRRVIVRLRERRDQAVEETYARVVGPRLLEQVTDERGLVMLDARSSLPNSATGERSLPAARVPAGRSVVPLQTDIGAAMADPLEFERRLSRMRAADRSRQYDGERGRELFRADDRAHLEARRHRGQR